MSAYPKPDQNDHEELEWKEYALPLPEPSAPIAQRVMMRVRLEISGARPIMTSPMKKLLPALIAILLLGASLSAYAADRIMEIRNKEGIVVLTAEKSMPAINDPFAPYEEQYSRQIARYYQQVMDELKPGEVAAYYVNDDIINALETIMKVKFVFKPVQYNNLTDLHNAAEATIAPQFRIPSSLPKGWTFQSGILSLKDPYWSMTRDEYEAYTDKFIQEAKELPSGEAIVMKRIEWKQSSVVNLLYVNGKSKLAINVMKLPDGSERKWEGKPINKGPWKWSIQPGASSELVTLKGISALYAAALPNASEKPNFGNELTWVDEVNNQMYRMQDFIEAPLSRKQFLAIAESMMGP